jgi:hypothetical protein
MRGARSGLGIRSSVPIDVWAFSRQAEKKVANKGVRNPKRRFGPDTYLLPAVAPDGKWIACASDQARPAVKRSPVVSRRRF